MTDAESTAPSAVVLRDIGLRWVTDMADELRALGMTPLLVSAIDHTGAWEKLEAVFQGAVQVGDPFDAAEVAAAAEKLAIGTRLAGVVTGSDGVIVTAAEAGRLLGLGGADPAGLARARNKYAARCALAAAGLPTPAFALLHGPGDVARVADEVSFPAVVKPLNGTAGHCVLPVRNRDELAEAYSTLATRLPGALGGIYARGVHAGGPGVGVGADADRILDPTRVFLVERMLRGREYCLDVVIRDGAVEPVALIDKLLVDERFFEEGFMWPAELAEDRQEELRRAAVDAVKALGLDQTVAHVELIDDATAGPTIVEVNGGRPGGQLLPRLNQLITGIDLPAECLALHLGLPGPERRPAALPIPLATLTVFASGSGRLAAIHGLAELAELPDVIDVAPAVQPGDTITSEFEHFAVNLLVSAMDGADAVRATHALAEQLVWLEMEDPDA